MIRLGKLVLHHCDDCNLPLLKSTCACGRTARPVALTPPGDIRPAFPADRTLVRKVLLRQFGSCVLPEMILLNSAPDIDKKDEVIIDGRVAGNIVYEVWKKRFAFQPRPWYAAWLAPSRGCVVADPGAVPSLLASSNLMAPGVLEACATICTGDEVIVVDEDGQVVATGRARMDGVDMVGARGMAVKIRHRETERFEQGRAVTWREVCRANANVVERRVGKARAFVRRMVAQTDLPFVVSFSGGKDSLATLLIVLEAGFRPPLVFLNTGLEYPETVQYVHEMAGRYELDLIEGDAGAAFWNALSFFGPPGKDFRWCCKTCKLGVAARLFERHFPDGVLSFIGQRRYESETRSAHGAVWKNPWVEGQVGASPIQNWTALHVWLYLFMRNAPYNPLYEKGLARIGCWLCPASDMGEFALYRHGGWEQFEQFLKTCARENDLPETWLDLGMWRWRKPPNWSPITYEIHMKRTALCPDGKKRIANFMAILGERAPSELDGEVVEAVRRRALFCVGCGVCVAKCPQDAITLKDGRAWIGEDCVHCLACMEECPVLVFW